MATISTLLEAASTNKPAGRASEAAAAALLDAFGEAASLQHVIGDGSRLEQLEQSVARGGLVAAFPFELACAAAMLVRNEPQAVVDSIIDLIRRARALSEPRHARGVSMLAMAMRFLATGELTPAELLSQLAGARALLLSTDARLLSTWVERARLLAKVGGDEGPASVKASEQRAWRRLLRSHGMDEASVARAWLVDLDRPSEGLGLELVDAAMISRVEGLIREYASLAASSSKYACLVADGRGDTIQLITTMAEESREASPRFAAYSAIAAEYLALCAAERAQRAALKAAEKVLVQHLTPADLRRLAAAT
ncbi:hypothetical protein COO60DRAFT_1646876 [Scenedesmus sp. NREL 46B-D3]|nr:hypothetical protein COO60DRAFT_1646876 [Scenedesmus sp. NREL 46B-D3]